MSKLGNLLLCLTVLPGLLYGKQLYAGEVRIAVAANFTAAMKEIAQQFENSSGDKTIISYGSTGKLYAQILNKAPFEVFLAADQHRPKLLEQKQLAGQRFTYATGKLVLWSSKKEQEVSEDLLKRADFNRLALANPKTAPYGAAAVTVMQRLGVDETLKPKWVRGESITQTYQFVATGNADIGFVAKSQIALASKGNSWEIPQALYSPIHQDGVLLKGGRDNPVASKFLAYLQSAAALKIIQKFGYAVE